MSVRFTDNEIEEFVSEEKVLPDNYRDLLQLRPKRGHTERDFRIIGARGNDFRIILRQSMHNALDFSVILGLQIPNSNLVFKLRRYNGRHGEHTNKIEKETFDGFHIHKATERYQELGAKEESFAEVTDRYADFMDAVECMLDDCSFMKPFDPQRNLFED